MIKNTLIATFFALIGSFVLFAWYHQWIIIMVGAPQPAISQLTNAHKKKSVLFFPKTTHFQQETKEIVYSKTLNNALQNILQEWLQIAIDEHYIPCPLQLQSVAFSFNHDELILSFNGLPFDKEASIEHKLRCIHALLKTIAAECPHLQKIYFFCNHKPFEDDLIDFSRPWPLDGFEDEGIKEHDHMLYRPRIIVIHPWGDAKNTGRKIHSTFERTYTLEYAHYIKKYLELDNDNLRVIITRSPGNIISIQQAAEFSNKLHADLYITLNCYPTTKNSYSISCFYLTYQPNRAWQKKISSPEQSLKLIPITQIHRFFESINKNLANSLLKQLKTGYGHQLEVNNHFTGIPVKLLQGVSCPSLALEIGIPQKEHSEIFLPILTEQLRILLSDG